MSDDGRPERSGPSEDDSGETESLPEGMRLRGVIVSVERVSAVAVPDGFPTGVETGEILALGLEFDRHEGRATTYAGFDSDDLATLLDVEGVSGPDDLEGVRLLVDVVDGHPVPVSGEGRTRGDDRAVYGVVAGVAPSITIALFSFFGLGEAVFSPVYIALYLVCTFLVLPASIYLDALHLRTTTDWEGRPLYWTLLAVVPPLYVVVVPFYLLSRESARPLALGTAGTP